MNPEEYRKLADIETRHWFYRGKRRLVQGWLDRLLPDRRARLLDVGAGTGLLVQELRAHGRAAYGLDPSDESLGLASPRNQGGMIQGSLTDLPFRDNVWDALFALDVLEHIADDRRAFHEMVRILRPRGYLFVHVPAFQFLWSDWDEALHHCRRYTRPQLLRLADSAPVKRRYATYTNTLAFPAILLYRALKRFWPFSGPRLEDQMPGRWLNAFLQAGFVLPARQPWLRLPFGVSFFAIFQKVDG